MPKLLRRIADLLGPHPLTRTGLRVLLFVGLSLLANGYVFGVADHGIHLAFDHGIRIVHESIRHDAVILDGNLPATLVDHERAIEMVRRRDLDGTGNDLA